MFLSEIEAELSLARTSKPIKYEAFLSHLKVLRSIWEAGLAYLFTNIVSTHEIRTEALRNAIVFIAASMILDYTRIIIGTMQNLKQMLM